MVRANPWLARSAALGRALAWRLRREGLSYLLAGLLPFAVAVSLASALPMITGGRAVNGAAQFAIIGARYGAASNTVGLGVMLILTPGLVALFTAVAVGRTVRGLVGAELGRGGLEALLSAPCTPGNIAAAILGCVMAIGTAFWVAMSGLGALAVAVVAAVSGGHLSLSGGYLALAFALPLLCVWAGVGLGVFASLLLPRLTQLGGTTNAAGGDLASGAALLPALGAMLALLFGAVSVGPVYLLLIIGGISAVIAVLAVTAVAYWFRPEKVLES